MSLARKCDRCKEFYVPSKYDHTISYREHETRPAVYYDVCPKCFDLFIKWINEYYKKDLVSHKEETNANND